MTRHRRDRRTDRLQPVGALLAALAPLAAVLPWVGVLEGGWLPSAIAMVVSMALASAIVRGITRSPVGTVAAALVAIAWCTWSSARAEALLGIVPTPASIEVTAAQLQSAIEQVLWTPEPPVPASAGLTVLVLAAVAVLAIAIDALVLVAGLPALAAASMLLPVVLPMAYAVELDVPRLIAAAVVATALLVVRRRARRVGRVGALAAVAAVTACAIAAPLALPAPRDADLAWDWFAPTGQGTAGAGAVVLSTGIDLASDLSRSTPTPVLSYTPSDGLPNRLRLTSLQGVGESGFVEQQGSLSSDFSDLGGLGGGDTITTEIDMGDVIVGNAPLPVQSIATDDFAGDWRWDAETQSIGFEDASRGVQLDGTVYEVSSLRSVPSLPDDVDPASTGHDAEREVPDEASAVAAAIDGIVDEGASPAERARQVLAYLTGDGWRYSEDVPFDGFGTVAGGGWDALEAFLQERVGYCVHYATAMALLARAADIPARVTIGFLPGQDADGDGTYAVTTNDMHAWAELWFDGYGWVPFDATPAVADGGSIASSEDQEPSGATEQPVLPSQTALPTPPPDDAAPTTAPSVAPDEPSDAPSPVPDGTEWRPPWALLLVPLALLLLATPAVVRIVLRRIRLRDGAGGAWEEVQASLADVGTRVRPSATSGELLATLRARCDLGDADAAAERLRAAAERAAFAADEDASPAAAAVDDVAAVRAAIGRSASRRRRRLRAALLPPSLVGMHAAPARLDDERAPTLRG